MLAVHSAATVGAMFGPQLVGWIATAHHYTASFHAAGLAHAASDELRVLGSEVDDEDGVSGRGHDPTLSTRSGHRSSGELAVQVDREQAGEGQRHQRQHLGILVEEFGMVKQVAGNVFGFHRRAFR